MYRTVLSYVVPNSKRKWTVPVSRLVYVNHGNHAVGLLRIYLKYFLERKKNFLPKRCVDSGHFTVSETIQSELNTNNDQNSSLRLPTVSVLLHFFKF